jgi:ATP-dependent DNA ligase
MATRERVLPVKCQRPVDYNEKAIQSILDRVGYVYVEPKHDGFRCHIVNVGGKLFGLTREGIELVSITERVRAVFAPFLALFPRYAIDCEVVIPGIPFEEASGLLRRLQPLEDQVPLTFHVFDWITQADLLGIKEGLQYPLSKRQRGVPYIDLAQYRSTLVLPVTKYAVKNLGAIKQQFLAFREQGYEGAVIKDPSQVYQNSKVNGWFKMKPSETLDGIITGFVDGTNSNKGKLVGFVVALENGTECRATGITKALMNEVTANPSAFLGRCVEVSAMEATAAGNTRHPKFKCFRDAEDKPGVKI